MRYFIELSYFGTDYRGWQIQRNAKSVQGVLNECLSLKLGQKTETTGSGRTDAGVHARQQFAHFNTDIPFELSELKYQLNCFLPSDISIQNISRVSEDAHARFDAEKRAYQYVITRDKDPFQQNLAYYFNPELDISLMNMAARELPGRTDFQSFSKVKTDVNHFECDISEAEWTKEGARLIFNISANRFLRGMVRAIVGTLLEVGQGRIDLSEFNNILDSKDRRMAGRSVPAHGLYLTRVKYPERIFNQE